MCTATLINDIVEDVLMLTLDLTARRAGSTSPPACGCSCAR
jgi:hypothetical protein